VRLTREDLLSEADIDGGLLAALEQYGIVRPGPAGFYDTTPSSWPAPRAR